MAVSAIAALASTVSYTAAAGFAFAGWSAFAINFALGAALKALSPKPSLGGNRGYQVNSRGSALDHQIIYGKVRVGGAIVYDEATGDNNQYLHRIIAVAGHEIESFDRIYINDSYVNYTDIDEDGNISEVIDSDGSTSSRYDGKLRIKFKFGTPNQTAESTLVDESDGLWTTDCRLRGIAYMYIRMEFNASVYPNGVPTFTAEVKGKKVYNPATDTTAWSDNPALCIRDYLTSSYGLAEDEDNIDDTLVNDAVSVCNQTNTEAGTTRYTCNGAFTTSLTPYDALNNLLTSMGGTLWYAQGKWRMKPAYWTTPVLNLNEDDLRSAVSVATRHSRRDNFNTVKGTFRGAESDWQTTDYPEVKSDASIAADGGQVSVADVDLPFTDNSIEARRLARIALERNRQQLTISASFGIGLLQVQVGDNIRLSNTRFGWNNKEFEVLSWNFGLTDSLDLQTDLILRETAESVFDEVDDGAAYERDNTNLASSFMVDAPQNLTVSDGGFLADDGTYVNSFIVDWDAPADAFVDYYVLEFKIQSNSVYKGANLTATEYEISPVREDVTYDIRVKAVNVFGASGPYASTTAQVGGDTTAPSVPTDLSADGAFRYITVSWTNPPEADFNYVEVFENSTNNVGSATKVGQTSGDNFVRPNLGISDTKWYFVRSVDYSGNTSAFSSGVSATTTFIDDPDFENGIYSLFTEQDLYAIKDVTSLPASGAFTGEKVFNRTDGKLYQWTGTVWEQVVGGAEDFSDLEGSIAGAQIPDGLIDTLKLADDAVSTAKLANSAVTTDILAASAVTETKISSNAITTPKIAAGAVTASEIAAGSITSNEIAANTIAAGNIAAGAITADEIATNAITSAKITAGAIIGDKIAASTITGDKIGANQITGNNISGQTITGDKVVANTITGGLLATSGIITNSAQINNAVVTNAKIENGAITTAKIGDLQVDTIKIANQAVSNTGVDEGTLSASNTTTYRTVASVTLSTDAGNQVVLWAAGQITFSAVGGEGSPSAAKVRLLKGGTVLEEYLQIIPPSASTTRAAPCVIASATTDATSTTFHVQVANGTTGGDATLAPTMLLVATELKK